MAGNTPQRIFSAAAILLAALLVSGCTGGSGGSSSPGRHSNSDPTPGILSAQTTLTLDAVDDQGAPFTGGFRWLVEEDSSFPVTPGFPQPVTLSTSVHHSHSPVLTSGIAAGSTISIQVPADKRLFISALPLSSGWQMTGVPVAVGQTSVTLIFNPPLLPTAQISVHVFLDNKPFNMAPDIPTEPGLPGFSVVLLDSLGYQMMDAFGNPIGTTYVMVGNTVLTDPDGNPMMSMMGTGVVKTDAFGEAIIKNLAPNKYGIQVIPPAGQGWIQTTTIEGTPTIDAWVRAGEPPLMNEFGFYFWHTFYGFTKLMDFPPSAGMTGTITGQVLYLHEDHPPKNRGVEGGRIVPDALVALNDLGATDLQVYAGFCDANGQFTIANVPPGLYQLVVLDLALDVIIDFRTVAMPATGGTLDLGEVSVFAWFGNFEGTVFFDTDLDGFPDPGEPGMPDQAINLRFTDGSIYKSTATDAAGNFSMTEVFPFYRFLIAEVDFLRYKATGATFEVDDGGTVDPGQVIHPQIQPDTLLPYRTEEGEVLLEAMLLYAGQTNRAHFGKNNYAGGENGGLSGIVYYATTRAENDPAWAAGDPWEPGIPRVQLNLYQDVNYDAVIDDLADADTVATLADVDNYPLDWAEGGTVGPEDLDRNLNGIFDPGDAVSIVWTDSWDDNPPTGCVGDPIVVHGVTVPDCAEIYKRWNQMRPGVFDGGYAFTAYVPNGIASGAPEVEGVPTGWYIVEVTVPPGYELVKEEDKNVDFGEDYIPSALLPTLGPPPCVGDGHTVGAELSLFPGVEAPFAGLERPLCDRKQVYLRDIQNTAADFFLFTAVPKAAMIWGLVADDLRYELDPLSINIGANAGIPWIPVAIRDYLNREILRTYTDEWGKYSTLVPGTYTVNVPAPSGVSADILQVCVNDPGPIAGGTDGPANDPFYNPIYGTACYNLDFTSGKTTFADTPLLPMTAMPPVQPGVQRVDCEPADGIPLVKAVNGPTGGPYAFPGDTVTLTSLGNAYVPNPNYIPGDPLHPLTVLRDYGFGGTTGIVTLNGATVPIVSWINTAVQVTVPAGATTGQLLIRRGDNSLWSPLGITLHVDNGQLPAVYHLLPTDNVQAVIDAAPPNSLLLLADGMFSANWIVWKPLKLQGYGAFSTILLAAPPSPANSQLWLNKLNSLIASNSIAFLPGELQRLQMQGTGGMRPGLLIGFAAGTVGNSADPPLVDGVRITAAVTGGAVFINTHADYTRISNSRIDHNSGQYGGGIRLGTPSITDGTGNLLGSDNPDVTIAYNQILINGGFLGGGGVSIFNGADGYQVVDNVICGNYTVAYGGGVEHFGLSDGGLIARNQVIFNEAFDEGGGIMVAGELVPAGAAAGTLTPGSGSVTIDRNLIQGNLSGDDGGGVRTLMVNGEDVRLNPGNSSLWWSINLFNNLIVNNVAADAGGGISLDDAALVRIIHNTVAHNDSTSTAIDAFGVCPAGNPTDQFCPPGANVSVPQVGGIHALAHSLGLQEALFLAGSSQTFSDPLLYDNIIYRNRTFYWDWNFNGTWSGMRPDLLAGETVRYWDLAVTGTPTPARMSPLFSILTDAAGYDASNGTTNPAFLAPYFNDFFPGGAGFTQLGNLITIAFKPVVPTGDYHIGGGGADGFGSGLFFGLYPELEWDYDGQVRGDPPDAGADER